MSHKENRVPVPSLEEMRKETERILGRPLSDSEYRFILPHMESERAIWLKDQAYGGIKSDAPTGAYSRYLETLRTEYPQTQAFENYFEEAGFQRDLSRQLLPFLLEESGIKQVKDPTTGKITYEKIPPLESEQLSKQVETEANKRTLAAIKGELPVSPALEKELSGQEAETKAALLEQLGPGYETGTPGIEALARERQRQSSIREAVRFGELSSLNAIGQARAGQRYGKSGQLYEEIAGAGVPEQQAAGMFATGGQLYEGPINRALQERMYQRAVLDQEKQRKRAGRMALLTSLIFGTAGGIFGGPAGAAAGAMSPGTLPFVLPNKWGG